MLTDDVERYIALRRTLGFQLRKPARHLRVFARVATEKNETFIRAATVIDWAAAAPTLDARNRRIGDVARFARFLRAEESRHEVPPTGLFATPKLRPAPYIYAPDEMARILKAAGQLRLLKPDPLRRQVYVMLFGLIAATGLRVSEGLKPRIPGEQTETLACRKGRHLSPRGQNPTKAPRRTGSSAVEEIAQLNRSASGTTTSLSC
jgi:integrase/recombinase XerD